MSLLPDSLAKHLKPYLPDRGPVVTVLRLSGVIGDIGGLKPGMTMEKQAALIDRAFAPKGLKAVALAINSPGGSPAQSVLIGDRIRALAAEKKVRVHAFVEDIAASGGYWLACAADEIHALPVSLVGSIGVISQGFGFTELIAKLGIERRVHTAGDSKSLLDPFRPEEPDQIALLHRIQEQVHGEFIDWVRHRRAGHLDLSADGLFEGRVWTGREALGIGLVDSLGDLRSTLRSRYGTKVRIKPIAQKKGFQPLRRLLPGSAEEGGMMGALEARLDWSRWGL